MGVLSDGREPIRGHRLVQMAQHEPLKFGIAASKVGEMVESGPLLR
jgi:hypothetical protein